MYSSADRQPRPPHRPQPDAPPPSQLAPVDARASNVPINDFGPQSTPRSSLPDPVPLLRNLALSTIEILQCTRELEHIARWVTESVYLGLKYRQSLAINRFSITGSPPRRMPNVCGNVHYCEPSESVVEATVLVHCRDRTRAVAIRLEGLDHRWRATAIGVL